MNENREAKEKEKAGISLAGAVDLSSSKKKQDEERGGEWGYSVHISSSSLESYAASSMTYPIIVLIHAGEGKGFAEKFSKAVEGENGRLQLLTIDASSDPEAAAMVEASALPSAFALIKGRLFPLFEGPVPSGQDEALIKESIAAALAGAREEALVGRAPKMEHGPSERGTKEEGGMYSKAERLEGEGDFNGAAKAFEKIAQDRPDDREAQSRAQKALLIARVKKMDEGDVRRRAAQNPEDAPSQLDAADLDFYAGHVGDAFSRLFDCVRRKGEGSRPARERILSYISILPPEDPRIRQARMELANILF